MFNEPREKTLIHKIISSHSGNKFYITEEEYQLIVEEFRKALAAYGIDPMLANHFSLIERYNLYTNLGYHLLSTGERRHQDKEKIVRLNLVMGSNNHLPILKAEDIITNLELHDIQYVKNAYESYYFVLPKEKSNSFYSLLEGYNYKVDIFLKDLSPLTNS